MIDLERRQVPTAALVSEPFADDARMTAASSGLANLPLFIPKMTALTNSADERIQEFVKQAYEQRQMETIFHVVEQGDVDLTDVEDEEERFEAPSYHQAYDDMNQAFLDYGWGDGFPVVPPTLEKVEEMVAGSRLNPETVVTVLPPGMGMATVRKIAVNAVMAGCKPAHMPILIAATEALTDPTFHYRIVAMSTGPHTPMMVVNGPIAKEIGMNSRRGALGPGAPSAVNTALGRALRLILMNIGHVYVGVGDLDVIGSPNKYSMCFAENEDDSPWAETYHMERGFNRDDNTVTLFGVESQLEIYDFNSITPEGLLTSYAGTINMIGSLSARTHIYKERHADNCVMLSPDHARIMVDAGWTKDDVKHYLYAHSRLQAKYYKNTVGTDRIKESARWIFEAADDELIPITGAYDWFHVVVVGGPAGKSSYTSGVGQAVTRRIRD